MCLSRHAARRLRYLCPTSSEVSRPWTSRSETETVIPTVTAGDAGVAGSALMRPVEVRGLPVGVEVVSVTPPEVLLSTH